jgi:hypothetical protein
MVNDNKELNPSRLDRWRVRLRPVRAAADFCKNNKNNTVWYTECVDGGRLSLPVGVAAGPFQTCPERAG